MGVMGLGSAAAGADRGVCTGTRPEWPETGPWGLKAHLRGSGACVRDTLLATWLPTLVRPGDSDFYSVEQATAMRITVLGAGYMGSAMATVAAARGHDVRLWGTWLDDELLEPVERGGIHPRLRLPLPGIQVLRAPRLAEALSGAELVIHGISSVGALAVMEKARMLIP